MAESTRISGDIEFVGDAVVFGCVQGKLEALTEGATLTVCKEGRASGSIRVPRLIVHGRVDGDIYVTEFLEIGATARMTANVHYLKLSEAALQSERDSLRRGPLGATTNALAELG